MFNFYSFDRFSYHCVPEKRESEKERRHTTLFKIKTCILSINANLQIVPCLLFLELKNKYKRLVPLRDHTLLVC